MGRSILTHPRFRFDLVSDHNQCCNYCIPNNDSKTMQKGVLGHDYILIMLYISVKVLLLMYSACLLVLVFC